MRENCVIWVFWGLLNLNSKTFFCIFSLENMQHTPTYMLCWGIPILWGHYNGDEMVSVPRVKSAWLDLFIFRNISFMMSWSSLEFISNMGNIHQQSPSKLVLKARELARAVIWFLSKENWSACCLCSQCVPQGGPPHYFSTLVGSSVSAWWVQGELSSSVNFRAGLGGPPRWAEWNAVSRSRCWFSSSICSISCFP